MNINKNICIGEVASEPFVYITHKDRALMKYTLTFGLQERSDFCGRSIVRIFFDTDDVEFAKKHINCAILVKATGGLFFADIGGNAMLKADNLVFFNNREE